MSISIVIPNYNGEQTIKPLLKQTVVWDLSSYEIIVVDDASTDRSVDFIQKNYPYIKIIRHQKNLGFTETANDGIKAALYSKILLLNNDVLLRSGQIENLFNLLEKYPDTFMVSPIIVANTEKKIYCESQMKFHWRKGVFYFLYEPSEVNQEFLIYSTGAACAFLKERFLELDGYERLFNPGYYEDMDLCFKAFTKGWKIRLDPSVQFEHAVSSTFSKIMLPNSRMTLVKRNWWLIHWLWLPFSFLFVHIFWLPYNLIRHRNIKGFLKALFRLPFIIKRRKKYYVHKTSFMAMIGKSS